MLRPMPVGARVGGSAGSGTWPGGGQPDRVLDRARPDQRHPVLFLERARCPRRWQHEQLGPARRQGPGQLGEPDVVTGHEADPEAAQGGEHDLIARRHAVGLAMTERVEQVDLPVHRHQAAVTFDSDGGVEDPAVRSGLEQRCDDGEPGGLRRIGEPAAERAVERLGHRSQVSGEARLRALGEDDQSGALRRRCAGSRPHPVEVDLRVGADRDLTKSHAHGVQRSWPAPEVTGVDLPPAGRAGSIGLLAELGYPQQGFVDEIGARMPNARDSTSSSWRAARR